MPLLSAHIRAVAEAARAGADAYRERLVLERSDSRFSRALVNTHEVGGWTTPAELSLLYHLALLGEGDGVVLEIGSFLGRSTIVLAQACLDAGRRGVVAVDPHDAGGLGERALGVRDFHAEFLHNLARAGVDGAVRAVRATSVEASREWQGEQIRTQFVDGWHSREAVLEDVRGFAPWLTPDCCIAFDDYMASEAVRAGVGELLKSGVLPDSAAIVGKVAAFAPPSVLERLPLPPGSRALWRLGPEARERAIRLGSR